MRAELREATAADHAAVLALNNRHVPHVNALAAAAFAQLVAQSAHFSVAHESDRLLGFVLCVPAGRLYWSDNYAWFTTRYEDFLYLDRVVVDPQARRHGIARALYADLHARARGRWPRVLLEVNLRPPNPDSVAFHEALGYTPIGVREYEGGAKAVQMYGYELGGDAAASGA
jgi:predicted GNAT superfamily acetyltransferase